MKYYISDLHFDHTNVIKFDNRPFKDVEEMNNTIINNWNNVVKGGDIVYALGDVLFGDENRFNEIVNKLNGQIVLVKGNHDRLQFNKLNKRKVIKIVDYLEIKDTAFGKSYKVYMSHYFMPLFSKHRNENCVHLYGHVHNSDEWEFCKEVTKLAQERYNSKSKIFNVGCMLDYMNYTPRTLEQILKNGEQKMVDLEGIKKCYAEKEKLDEELIKQLNLIKDILGPCFTYKEFDNFINYQEITCVYDILDVNDGILDIFFLNENMDLGIVSLDKELLTMSEEELRQIRENG